MSWKFYGVKSLYRIVATGRARATDDDYDPDAAILEERVVLIRARSFDEALKKGEAEARKYPCAPYRNPYGQVVKVEYLESLDAFEMFEKPGSGVEVFSSQRLVGRKTKARELVDSAFGAPEPRGSRVKFVPG